MAATQTVQVPHLEAQVGYAISNNKLDPSKPTWVLINSMCTSVEFYRAQLDNKTLTAAVNLVAIEPLGHGATTCATEHFTYWDTALITLQALEALGVKKAYALGTSQGGWIIVRMALLAPEKILGLLPLGTSMDAETSESREKGCWDPVPFLQPFLEKWGSPTPNFVVGDDWIQAVIGLGFGSAGTPQVLEFWTETLRRVYSGDEGRRKLRMAAICLADRDGLQLRIGDIKCPVHWLHGSTDAIYTHVVAQEHSKGFTGSSDFQFNILEGGAHFLVATHPKEVEDAILAMTAKA
ncbi:putative alpha/beta hydrolase [Daldinia loculata]|uniref:putative alpha/beta hydrolase n=1 Tax=Daldinia loculata TaxID=103429 RepID=UPI0020C496BA|nr:putative alpha/beta hydrolase [Daldinia loculata]KAI1648434.1 putative alpha/beta hydrolase [Daldinia loculata]KAI2782826.1 putative alpha/beta hydrolase [Daldinia loculata]